MTAARAFADLADELHNGDARRRSAAATALASFGQEAIPAIVAATLPRSDDDSARRGAWAAFRAMGGPASHWVTAAVMSPDTLLADASPVRCGTGSGLSPPSGPRLKVTSPVWSPAKSPGAGARRHAWRSALRDTRG